jgi:hypothetical protein
MSIRRAGTTIRATTGVTACVTARVAVAAAVLMAFRDPQGGQGRRGGFLGAGGFQSLVQCVALVGLGEGAFLAVRACSDDT